MGTRRSKLLAVLRTFESSSMNMGTAEVVAACQVALPDATIEEIITALAHLAEEHRREAEEPRWFRRRQANHAR